MNTKQVAKFILVSILAGIVYSIFLGVAQGILEVFLKEFAASAPSWFAWVFDALGLLMTVFGVATAAKFIYKKPPLARNLVPKLALVTTLVSVALSVIFLVVFSKQLSFLLILPIAIDSVLIYFATYFFVKKYSVQ
jgi:hypothetical protein